MKSSRVYTLSRNETAKYENIIRKQKKTSFGTIINTLTFSALVAQSIEYIQPDYDIADLQATL